MYNLLINMNDYILKEINSNYYHFYDGRKIVTNNAIIICNKKYALIKIN
jgi:hypothetical protein